MQCVQNVCQQGVASLSKKEGVTAFIVKSHDKDNGRKFKVDTNFVGEPVREYHTSGQLLLYPRNDGRQVIYCSGPSGSGKSTQAMLYATLYHQKYPQNEIVVVSPKKKDPVLCKIPKLSQYSTNNTNFVVDKIKLKELENSLVIFDDFESCEKNIQNGIVELINQICVQGRSLNISAFIITHVFSNYQQTRTMLAEAHCIMFPLMGGTLWVRNYLKNSCGLTNDQINRMMELKSRFVTYNKFPSYVLANQSFYLI